MKRCLVLSLMCICFSASAQNSRIDELERRKAKWLERFCRFDGDLQKVCKAAFEAGVGIGMEYSLDVVEGNIK